LRHSNPFKSASKTSNSLLVAFSKKVKMAIPNPRPFNEAEHPPKLAPGIGVKEAIACYPPRLENIEILGYVDDASNIGYSRDIGRSAILKGRVYYMFGDTFCKNKKGEFIGVQSTTSALVPDKSQPLSSTYLTWQEDGLVDNFVPLTEAEHRLEKIVWNDKTRPRVTLWAFGGMVETLGAGWLWYQKGVIYEEEGKEENKYHGTGIARVEADDRGRLTIHRSWPEMFNVDEPRVGTFSSIVEGDFVYLWGDHGAGCGDGIILSRVHKYSLQNKDCYTYWNGDSYVADWRAAEPVFGKMQSGAIIKTRLFGEERPWVFVGCTAWGDSKLMLGASATLEGPFDEKAICTAQGIDYPDTIMYCMYPHTWALDVTKGELLVTWSEQWPGGVVGAKIGLVLEER
jgi:hypothetical protein